MNSIKNNSALTARGIVCMNYRDKMALYDSYMPFIAGGGLFVPCEVSGEVSGEHNNQLGDELFLLITLPDGQKFSSSGKVVWMNAEQKVGKRVPGIGVQLTGAMGKEINATIISMLDKKITSSLPTATM